MTAKQSVVSFTISVLLMLVLGSCEKVFMEDEPGSDPVSVFEEIWDFTDRHYSFFDEKEIDWDEVYQKYRPFVRDDMNPVELFDLCAEMLYELRDGHVNLLSSFDRSRYWEWYLDSPENFYYSVVERNYLRGDQRYIGPLQFVVLEGGIAYVYYGSFANRISEGNLDLLVNSLSGLNGLIIDVRNNGGGDPSTGRDIAARFTDDRVFVGTNYVKTGPGKDSFRAEKVYINPHKGDRYSGRVVVLTNRRSYSATTYFAQYMRELENVTLMGDTTGGGGGLPAFRDLPNGWLLRVSSTRFLSPDGKSIEKGVPPHINASLYDDNGDFPPERDNIIDSAVELMLKQ